jgi:hypothetical protein
LTVFAVAVALVAATGSAMAQSYNSGAYCENYARDVSLRASRGGALGGAARGAVGGAAIGGVVNGRKGAGRGAAIGAVSGGVARGVQRNAVYDQAFRDCMNGVVRY